MRITRLEKKRGANEPLRAAIFDIEPDMRLLEGLVANLRVLGEAEDARPVSAQQKGLDLSTARSIGVDEANVNVF